MRTRLVRLAITVACCAFVATIAQAQTWTTLTNRPPASVGLCLLLTDGGVMCQAGSAWYKLTPSLGGSYATGTWSSLANLPSGYVPDAFASAVLADGRVAVIGGEYNSGTFVLTNQGAIYDPQTNAWTVLSPPPSTGSPNHMQCLGDAPAIVLADGRFLVGSKLFQDLAVLDPATLGWSLVTATGKTDGFNSEEGWTLLPDGSVFTLDVKNAPAAERLLLAAGSTSGVWASAGNTVQDLHTPTTSGALTAPGCPVYNPPGEIGPTLLLPDGRVFAVGADGYTGVYTPPAPGSQNAGSWAQGPALPSGLNVEDGPGAVLPNGHVLFGASPGASGTGLKYFEFDGTNLVSVPAPARASSDATYYTSLLLLPTGQILFVDGTTTVQLYTPAASPAYNPAWAPAITSVLTSLATGQLYEIQGTQFNGLGQGTAFGDESQNATNYPLVRITNAATGHVFYARTHGHSTMGVATGSAVVSTNFELPASIEAGAATLQVVANGIPSTSVAVTITSSFYATSTTVAAVPSPSVVGQAVTLTATTTSSGGTPTGKITFYNGTAALGTGTLNAQGQTTLTTSALAVGSRSITATYGGAANFSASASPAFTQVVTQDGTTTKVTSSRNPSKHGQSITFTATVAAAAPGAGTPTGTVTFKDGTKSLGSVSLRSGRASYSTSSLATGAHQITAVYAGSTSFLTSTSAPLAQTVN